MTKIYGVYRSRASRIYWLAEEMGIAVDAVPVIQANRLPDPLAADAPFNTRSPDFLKISPAGAVPVMEDDGLVISESLAITLYLARKHGGPLAAADAAEDAQMLQWALYGATAIEPFAIAILYAHMQGRAETPAGLAEIAAAAETLRRPLTVLEDHLAKTGHMVGGRFTVADINMAEILRYLQVHKTLLSEYPGAQAWLTAAQARPAFRAMWARRDAEPA